MSKDIIFRTLMLKGESGSSIVGFEKTSSELNVDTYTITFSDGTQASFDVTNGASIQSIEKTATTGATDTYTITLTNGDTETFEVTNGESYEVPEGGVILFDGVTAPPGYEIINNPLSGATSALLFAKKVSDTDVKGFGEIINSFNTGDNKTTNAPSLAAVEKRTDNNLLSNSDFMSYNVARSALNETIDGTFEGWKIIAGGYEENFGSPWFYLASGGTAIPASMPSACYIEQSWYSNGYLDLDYVTFSMEYKASESGEWGTVSATFNASAQTPPGAYLVTLNGCAVSVSPFNNGALRLIFDSVPSSTFYIRKLKLERGTSATAFYADSRDSLLVTNGAYLALRTFKKSDYFPFFKPSEFPFTFDYFGGAILGVNVEPDASTTYYYELLFNLSLEKAFDPYSSLPDDITANLVVIDGGNVTTAVTKAEIVENGRATPYTRILFGKSELEAIILSTIQRGYCSSVAVNLTIDD